MSPEEINDLQHRGAVGVIGAESKVKALLESLGPYGVKEIVQSGAVAITRGPRSITDQLKEK